MLLNARRSRCMMSSADGCARDAARLELQDTDQKSRRRSPLSGSAVGKRRSRLDQGAPQRQMDERTRYIHTVWLYFWGGGTLTFCPRRLQVPKVLVYAEGFKQKVICLFEAVAAVFCSIIGSYRGQVQLLVPAAVLWCSLRA